MSTTKKSSPTRHRREKENKEKRERPQRGNERLKVVVRRLPPNLPEDIFWQSVQNWVNEETVSWKIFYPGKFKTRLNKENIPSRAYIAFKHIEQLAQFSREYDGHLFKDKAGNESFAIVEFAPYQKVPSEKKKQDSRNGTIEKDEDYISFVESLKASANAEPVTLEALIAATKPASPPKTTPLLEALKAEKTAQKDKETILRSHAHYKDVALLRNKEDPKKKLAAAAANQKFVAAEAASAMGKRGKKGGPAVAPPAIQDQNQKAAAGAKGGAPPPPQPGAGSSALPPTTPGKKSRAQRHAQQQAKAQTTSTPSALTPVNVQPPVTIATAPKVAPAAVSSGGAVQSTPPTPGGQRRARPVIGLASRQFEAALSGVGVASGERKSRREKEKERQQDKDKDKDKEGTSVGGAPNSNDKEKPPPSPKRERGGRRGGAPGGGKPNTNEPQVVKVPSILQRPEGTGPPAILQRDTAAGAGLSTPSGATSSPPVAQTPVQGGGSAGGGGRGGRRGRGRGRGGPPAGSHRGG